MNQHGHRPAPGRIHVRDDDGTAIDLIAPGAGGQLVFRVTFTCATCYRVRTETIEAPSYGAVAARYEAPRCRGCRR